MLLDEVNAFRLFKEAKSGLQIIKYFSQRHGLHLHVRTRVGVLRGCMFQNPPRDFKLCQVFFQIPDVYT